MYSPSLSDTLRSLASKLDGVQAVLNGYPGTAPDSMRSLNTTVPNVGQGTQMILLEKLDSLSKQLEDVNRNIMGLRNQNKDAASILPLNPMHGIEVVPKREVVLSEGNSLSVADRLLLNKDAKKALEAEEMGVSRQDAYPLGEDDDVYSGFAIPINKQQVYSNSSTMEIEEEEEVVEEEEVIEEEEEAEEEAEEEVEEEEDADSEAEEEVLDEFEYKGGIFYRDSKNNVFMTDEDGDLVDEPIGIWSSEKERIIKKP